MLVLIKQLDYSYKGCSYMQRNPIILLSNTRLMDDNKDFLNKDCARLIEFNIRNFLSVEWILISVRRKE